MVDSGVEFNCQSWMPFDVATEQFFKIRSLTVQFFWFATSKLTKHGSPRHSLSSARWKWSLKMQWSMILRLTWFNCVFFRFYQRKTKPISFHLKVARRVDHELSQVEMVRSVYLDSIRIEIAKSQFIINSLQLKIVRFVGCYWLEVNILCWVAAEKLKLN